MKRRTVAFACVLVGAMSLAHGACVDIVGVTEIPADHSDAGPCHGVCSPGEQQCVPPGNVETCGPDCTWESPSWSCTTGECSDGGCSGLGPHNGSANPSCAGTDGTCSGGSCCLTYDVVGGTYDRTYSDLDGGDGRAVDLGDPATVSGFGLDAFEVTVARFRRFVTALADGEAAPSEGTGKHVHLNDGKGLAVAGSPGTYEAGWDKAAWGRYIETGSGASAKWNEALTCTKHATWTPSPGKREDLPINCVSWFEAYAFCIWDGGFLPSETEWEYAAAGGSEELEFPWGSTAPGTKSQYAIYDNDYESDAGTEVARVGTASLGLGRWGHLDLAGNVWEWTLDWYASYVNPCVDCANLTTTPQTITRPVRGGSFGTVAPHLSASFRDDYAPSSRAEFLGFRCARTP